MSVSVSAAHARARRRARRFERLDHEGGDPARLVAEVAAEKWAVLLGSYEGRLEREELEDCLSQATLELIRGVRAGRCFEGAEHVANALELRFRSRIVDQYRARSARPAVVALDREGEEGFVLEDPAPRFEREVEARVELARLRELVGELSADEQRVLALQAAGVSRGEICARLGWKLERYRSTARRATNKLSGLVAATDRGERCRELRLPLYAWVAGVASEQEARRLAVHVGNCPGCRAEAAALRRARQQLAELVPWPVLVGGGLLGWLAERGEGARTRLSGLVARDVPNRVGHPESAAGGALAGGGAAKAVVAACLAAGAVSGACLSTGVFSPPAPHRLERHAPRGHSGHALRRHTRLTHPLRVRARRASAPRRQGAPALKSRRVSGPPPRTYAASPPPAAGAPRRSPPAGEFTLGPTQPAAAHTTAASRPAPAPASGAGEFAP